MSGFPDTNDALRSLLPISLAEMDGFRLMNRVDTKYVFSSHRIPEILERMNGNYKVLEIQGERAFEYHTTYLDTSSLLFFTQHVTGRLERNKVRFRRYNQTGTTFLEVKKRTNKNRTIKWRIEKELVEGSHIDDRSVKFIEKHVPDPDLRLSPVLINNFTRITLTGLAVNERITIDCDLSFSDLTGNRVMLPHLAIIEHKRDAFTSRSPLNPILKASSIHPTGFSKYCIGTAFLYDHPRKGILKPKLLLLNRIENEYTRSLKS